MKLTIQQQGQIALATANVRHGWRQLANTFGFSEESRMDIPKSRILRVQASIHAWPNIFGNRLLSYPQNVYGLFKAEWGRVELREQDLRIALELPQIEAQRLKRSGLPGIYQEPIELDKQSRIGFWFSLLVVVCEIVETELPDIIEWDTQFLSGGRPGGSRRH